MKIKFPSYISFWLPVLIGLLLLPVPLLGNFHVESALIAAFVGCFWAGISACTIFYGQSDWKQIRFILREIYLVGLPLFIFAVATGCFSWSGMGFWLLYPLPSVLFGYSFGRMLRLWEVSFRKGLTVLFLLIFAVGVLVIEFLNLPQVYFYNHVWGGWPGPIYDETITISWALVFFRGLTLLWTGLFWSLATFTKSKAARISAVFCIAYLIFGYSLLPQMGVISPRSYIQKQLGGVKQTEHFVVYYEKSGYTKDEIKLIALEHEFYFQQITEALNIDEKAFDKKIESYMYANAWQKNRLTGAKFTSYVPVWLDQDQLHIAKQQLPSLKHELVHVLAKQFGNDILNASWSIGLVEGLAVALAGDVSSRSTIHQIVAAEKPWPDTEEMKQALSLWGFYGGRSTVNYTTTGSFVRYLLNRYPVGFFKEAYRTANIDMAYTQSFNSLIEGWHRLLTTVTVDSLDQQIAARLFSIPSIFEQACPHVLSPVAQHLQNYQYYLTVEDTAAAIAELNTLRQIEPDNDFIQTRWMVWKLKTGDISEVLTLSIEKMDKLSTRLRYADALALIGEWKSAQKVVKDAAAKVDSASYLLQKFVKLRLDKSRWKSYMQLAYTKELVKPTQFYYLSDYVRLLAIGKAIQQEKWKIFANYAVLLLKKPLNSHYFDVYLKTIHYLAYRNRFNIAEKWINKVKHLKLRKRYKYRLQQQIRWLNFMKSTSKLIK